MANAFQIRSRGHADERAKSSSTSGGDPEAWDEVFQWLWPAAFAVVQLKLQPFPPQDVEDVAIEALEALVEKVGEVKSVREKITGLRDHGRQYTVLEPLHGQRDDRH